MFRYSRMKSKKLKPTTFRKRNRRATRRNIKRGGMPITALNLTDRITHPSEDKIIDFITNDLSKTGPNIINIPMPADENDTTPEFHAILVDIRGETILVSDWGGDRRKNKSRYFYDWPKWRTYRVLIESLEQTFGKPVIFANVDSDLYKSAHCKHELHRGQGGCSEYIYNWANRHYPDAFTRRSRTR